MFSMIDILGVFVVFLRGEVETRSYYVAVCLEIIYRDRAGLQVRRLCLSAS